MYNNIRSFPRSLIINRALKKQTILIIVLMFTNTAEFNEHAQSGQLGAPFSDLPALIKHYTESRNLSNCFDCTLHYRGRSFVSEFFLKLISFKGRHFFSCRLFNLCYKEEVFISLFLSCEKNIKFKFLVYKKKVYYCNF